MNKYTPVYENGQRKQIHGMAATSIAKKWYRVSYCEACRVEVAWAQSTKTGKWYVCEVARYTTEGGYERFRAVPYSFHSCKPSSETRSPEHRAMGDD